MISIMVFINNMTSPALICLTEKIREQLDKENFAYGIFLWTSKRFLILLIMIS